MRLLSGNDSDLRIEESVISIILQTGEAIRLEIYFT